MKVKIQNTNIDVPDEVVLGDCQLAADLFSIAAHDHEFTQDEQIDRKVLKAALYLQWLRDGEYSRSKGELLAGAIHQVEDKTPFYRIGIRVEKRMVNFMLRVMEGTKKMIFQAAADNLPSN